MKIRNIKYLIIAVSITFNIVHGMIPHNHEKIPYANFLQLTAHNFQSDCLDIIIGTLKFNLGQDHLDNYLKVNSIQCPIQFCPLFERDDDWTTANIFSVQEITLVPFNKEPSSDSELGSTITRGPPAFLV